MGKPREVKQVSKVSKALQARAAGLTYAQIADLVGYSGRSAAFNAIQRELASVVCRDVEHLRNEALYLLDMLQARVWPHAFPGNGKPPNLWAVDRLLAIHNARSRLVGLDAEKDGMPVTQVVIREIPANYMGLAAGATIDAGDTPPLSLHR